MRAGLDQIRMSIASHANHPESNRGWALPLILALLSSALCWGVIFVAVPPGAQDFPLGDDWAFNLGAFLFAGGQGIHYSQWASMPQLGQWMWACPFIWSRGESFIAVRLSTILLSWLGLAAFYDLLRRDGELPARRAGFATAAFALNPLFFLLQGTFMTDVPSLSFALMALALYTRALAGDRLSTLFAACAVAMVGAITRQNTVAVPVAVGILLLRSQLGYWLSAIGLRLPAVGQKPMADSRKPFTPWLFAISAPIVTGVITHGWFIMHGDILDMPLIQSPPGLALTPYLLIHTCGLSVLPLVALDPRPVSWQRFGIALAIMLGGAAYWSNYPWGYGFVLPYGGLFPYCTGMMGPYGAFAGQLVAGERDVLLTTNVRVVMSLLGCVGGAWLIDRTLDKVRSVSALGPIMLFTLLQVCLLLMVRSLYDRYLLVFLPGALFLASSARGHPRPRWVRGFAMLLVFAAVSVGLMHDWLAWNAARWAIGRRAVAAGINPLDIEGGFEWNGWHAPRPRVKEGPLDKGFTLHFTDSFFPHVTGRYALTFSPLRGTVPLDWESYDQWLIPGRKDFLLVQVPVSPRPTKPTAPASPASPKSEIGETRDSH